VRKAGADLQEIKTSDYTNGNGEAAAFEAPVLDLSSAEHDEGWAVKSARMASTRDVELARMQ
jgi:hypothetical protein